MIGSKPKGNVDDLKSKYTHYTKLMEDFNKKTKISAL